MMAPALLVHIEIWRISLYCSKNSMMASAIAGSLDLLFAGMPGRVRLSASGVPLLSSDPEMDHGPYGPQLRRNRAIDISSIAIGTIFAHSTAILLILWLRPSPSYFFLPWSFFLHCPFIEKAYDVIPPCLATIVYLYGEINLIGRPLLSKHANY